MMLESLHPSEQLADICRRIYDHRLTTTSGGNLSVSDENGDLWITPGGIDKGNLTPQDMVHVQTDGTVVGRHRPSSELPFHKWIYQARPDLKAIIHAHPSALVAFSIVRKAPNTALFPSVKELCGDVGIAEYAVPGSEELGKNIADVFATGANVVILENHGIVIGSETLLSAFAMLEAMENLSTIEINGKRLGRVTSLTAQQLAQFTSEAAQFDASSPGPGTPSAPPTREDSSAAAKQGEDAREVVRLLTRRAYEQGLFATLQGLLSVRLGEDSFLVNSDGVDRNSVGLDDILRINEAPQPIGGYSAALYGLLREIYRTQPDIHAVIAAYPPSMMGFAITDEPFDARLIPESYVLLRTVGRASIASVTSDPQSIARQLTADRPMLIIENCCVIATGSSALQAFDRLEVAESSAKAIIHASAIGSIIHMNDAQLRDIEIRFNLPRQAD